MKKKTMIETQLANTKFEDKQSEGILGKIKGTFADYINGTRNSDRHYTEELWDTRVFNNEDVMEALNTGTLYGELDHPEGDRCETLATNAAFTITKLEKNVNEGTIEGEALILDTPTGRTLYTLCKVGAQIGISSRGIGEEVEMNGMNVIDPSTYDFITFDAVVTPSNKRARVALVENKQKDIVKENYIKQIKDVSTLNQVYQIRNSLNILNEGLQKDLEEILIKKEDELESKIESNKNNKFSEVNKKAVQKIISKVKAKTLEEEILLNEEHKKINEELNKENEKVKEELRYFKESRKSIKKELNSIKNEFKIKEQNLEHNKKVENQLKKIRARLLNEKNELNKNNSILARKVKILQEKLDNKNTDNKQLIEANLKLTEKLKESSKLLIENQKLKEDIKNINKSKLEESNRAINTKKLQEQKEQNYKNRINKLMLENKKLISEKVKVEEKAQRFSKLSFNPISNFTILEESSKLNNVDNYNSEEMDLLNTLVSK